MKRFSQKLVLLAACICAAAGNITAQEVPQRVHVKFRVLFKDKIGTPYRIDKPEAFLSEKAIMRRMKQQIPIVENDLPVNPEYVAAIASMGIKVLNRSKWMNAVTIELADSQIITKVEALSFVHSTKKIARTKPKEKKDDLMEAFVRLFEEGQTVQKPKKATGSYYGSGAKQVQMLNGNALHQQGFNGRGITIAVLDAGFSKVNENRFFDSLRVSGRLLGTRDFVEGGESVFEDNSHGASVLSVMAANIPDEFVGSAAYANYWLLRTEDADSEYLIEEDNWVTGAEFADSVGADIINSSLGYTRYDDPGTSYTQQQLNGKTAWITRAGDIAASKGILVVNSAGNSGADSWKYMGVPADGDSVMAIGAVGSAREYAPFSSQGPTADGRIKPNVTAMGMGIPAISPSGNIAPYNGTSFSSPLMAGMAACLWQACPQASAMQVFKAIEQSASQYDSPDALKGFGIPDFSKAQQLLTANLADKSKGDSIVHLYYNPFIKGLVLEYYSNATQKVALEVKNTNGKRVLRKSFEVFAHQNSIIRLPKLRKLKSGQYELEVVAGEKKVSRRITVK